MPNEQPVLPAAPPHERPGVAVAARLVDTAARVERVEEDAREAVKDLQTRGPYGHRVGWVDLDVGGSHGLGTVATSCSSRIVQVEHPVSLSQSYQYNSLFPKSDFHGISPIFIYPSHRDMK